MSKFRYLSKSKLSELTGKDRRTINKRLESLEPHEIDGRAELYDVQLALPLIYATELTAGIERKLQEEEFRYQKARADKMELEVQKRRGELVEIEKVAKTVEQEYSAVRAALKALPSKMAHPLAPLDKPNEIKGQLEEAVNEILTELSADQRYASENITEDEPDNEQSREEITSESEEGIEADTETEPS